jgi:hypothetical protein
MNGDALNRTKSSVCEPPSFKLLIRTRIACEDSEEMGGSRVAKCIIVEHQPYLKDAWVKGFRPTRKRPNVDVELARVTKAVKCIMKCLVWSYKHDLHFHIRLGHCSRYTITSYILLAISYKLEDAIQLT